MTGALNPGVSVGTTKPRMPSSVCAHTTATSATAPLVIHILVPLSTQSSPSRLALVRIPDGLEPKSGSVSPKQPIASPAAIGGQPLLLLLLAAPLPDREHRQRALHADQRADPGVDRLQLHAGQPVRHRAGARAAVPVQVHAEHAEAAELLGQLARRDGAGLEPVGDVRAEVVVAELADGVADRPLLVGQQGVGGDQVERARPAWGLP